MISINPRGRTKAWEASTADGAATDELPKTGIVWTSGIWGGLTRRKILYGKEIAACG
jgi:hypothetical protein